MSDLEHEENLQDMNYSPRLSVYGDHDVVVAETGENAVVFTPGQKPQVLEAHAPDGGYGWVIVFAVFVIHIIVDGVSYSFGVLLPDLLDRFGGTKSQTSWVTSIMIGTTYGCGPIPSYLALRFGRRAVAFVGAILACSGAFLSCFATEIWHLALSFGFLTGLGFGFLYLPAVVSVNCWFDKRRAMAVGFAVCGTGLGTVVFAPLTSYFLREMSLHGCLISYAGIILNASVCAALLRPTPLEVQAEKRQELQRFRIHTVEERELDNLLKGKTAAPNTGSKLTRMIAYIKSNIDMDLLRQWRFWIFCLTAFFGGISSYIPYTYLPHRAESEVDEIGPDDAAFLVSFIGFANLFGRLASSVISDRPWFNRIMAYSVFCLIAGVSTSLSVFCANYEMFVTYSLIYGFSGGFIIALQSVVLTDIVGLEKLTAAFGMLLFLEGTAVFVGPPIAGAITDYHGTYTIAFVVFGILMALAGCSLLVIPLFNCISARSKKRGEKVKVRS